MSNNDKLTYACGGKVEYWADKANDTESAGLEPNHTQFLLVDKGDSTSFGPSNFGAEQDVLEKIQLHLNKVYNAPTVLVVIQGFVPGTQIL